MQVGAHFANVIGLDVDPFLEQFGPLAPQSPVIHFESALNASSACALPARVIAAIADNWQIKRALVLFFFIPTSSSLLLLTVFSNAVYT
ncbi:hypothetical protein C4K18_4561 [Pseudomonas chlororaphis subsp. aurantiaca]|nr:hypothetical protein C4K18_4561 [Pseudomonas chlororaphis subsp. aurantiaca]